MLRRLLFDGPERLLRFRWRRRIMRVLLWLLIGGGVAGLLVVVVWAVWKVPQALYGYVPEAKDRASVEAATRTGMIAGLAGLAALGSLALTTRTYRLTQEGQLTDRYTKAIAQLGEDKLDVRLSGIYALERLAVDSKRDHPTIVEVLSAYVRERAAPAQPVRPAKRPTQEAREGVSRRRRRPGLSPVHKEVKLGIDVQAALTVLGRLPYRCGVRRADLHGANLTGANLLGANLTKANLARTDLAGAWLVEANLSGATLIDANLSGADLDRTNLSGATLIDANLSGARLDRTNLNKAWLIRANLSGAWLIRADLTDAFAHPEQLDVAHIDSDTRLPARSGSLDDPWIL